MIQQILTNAFNNHQYWLIYYHQFTRHAQYSRMQAIHDAKTWSVIHEIAKLIVTHKFQLNEVYEVVLLTFSGRGGLRLSEIINLRTEESFSDYMNHYLTRSDMNETGVINLPANQLKIEYANYEYAN